MTNAAAPPRTSPLTISAANFTLRQLQALVAVADRGGFRAAAAALHMTQSAVSQAVIGLERVLAVPLLVRERRGVVPTAMGQRILAHARRVLREADQIAAAAVAHYDAGSVNVLRLASIRSVAARVLHPVLRTFEGRHPHLLVSLWEGTDDEVHAWLQDGLVDVGFVAPALAVPAGAIVVALGEDPWYALVHGAHPLAGQARVSLGELVHVPYVMSDSGCEPAVRALFERAGVVPDVGHRALGTDTLMGMVASELGWTLVPGMAIAAGVPDGTVALPIAPPLARTVSAVLPAGAAAPPDALVLIESVRQATIARPPGSARRAGARPDEAPGRECRRRGAARGTSAAIHAPR